MKASRRRRTPPGSVSGSEKVAASEMSIVLGVTWYRREHWPRLVQLYPDRDIMHPSFDDWLRGAEKIERDMKARGQPDVQGQLLTRG